MQYLNSSDVNKDNHKCMSCPLGASCEGNIDWSGVKVKSGWWRIEDHKDTKDRLHPPKCLEKHKGNVKPPCAFVKCFDSGEETEACIVVKENNRRSSRCGRCYCQRAYTRNV